MAQMLIFGMGYAASHLAGRLRARGWEVEGTTRDGRAGGIAFDDERAVHKALRGATHILSSVPPAEGRDPVLARYGEAIALAPAAWTGYLSSTGVYGDTRGAWVDESAPVKGRRADRNAADAAWSTLRSEVSVFRLPGIYGPGRSILDRIREGRAHRIDLPDQVFSRVHVDNRPGTNAARHLMANTDYAHRGQTVREFPRLNFRNKAGNFARAHIKSRDHTRTSSADRLTL